MLDKKLVARELGKFYSGFMQSFRIKTFNLEDNDKIRHLYIK